MRRLALMIAIAVLGLGFIGFIVWFVILRDPSALPTTEDLGIEQVEALPAAAPANGTSTTTTPVAPAAPTPGSEDRETVLGLAKSFAERYGSYSSRSSYGNVRDSLPLMTAAFAERSRQLLASSPAAAGEVPFTATAARALRADAQAFDAAAGTARVEVLLQVQELTSEGQQGSVSYRTMALAMAKEDGAWKVDSAGELAAQ
jgi:hypothetical protein